MIGGAMRWECVINLEDNVTAMVRATEVRAAEVRDTEVEFIVVKDATVRPVV